MTEYGKNFSAGLADGKVVIRSIWKNPNKPGQTTVQFLQKVKVPAGLYQNSNMLVGIAQGYADSGFNYVTAMLSFKHEVVVNAKLIGEADEKVSFYETDRVIDAETLFGVPVGISIEENFVQNPNSPNQTPKINPTTSEVVEI